MKIFKIQDTETGKFYGGSLYGDTFYRSRNYETHKAAHQEKVRLERMCQHSGKMLTLTVKCYTLIEIETILP